MGLEKARAAARPGEVGKGEKSNLLAPRNSASILAIRTPISLHWSQPNDILISLLDPMKDGPSLSIVVQPKSQQQQKSKHTTCFKGEWKEMERKSLT